MNTKASAQRWGYCTWLVSERFCTSMFGFYVVLLQKIICKTFKRVGSPICTTCTRFVVVRKTKKLWNGYAVLKLVTKGRLPQHWLVCIAKEMKYCLDVSMNPFLRNADLKDNALVNEEQIRPKIKKV